MAANMACIAGEEIYRQWEAGRITGQRIGQQPTPFGPSGELFLVQDSQPFYLLPRHCAGRDKITPCRVNYRANMYALKDLGVQHVLAWGPAGAVTHSLAVGDLVIVDDLIDQTHLRPKTFFEDSPLGFLRQFPVFCPALRKAAAQVLTAMKLMHRAAGTVAVVEGPRLETPAEVRMLSAIGGELVTHAFVPEVFLAKELQMCYAAVCYVVNYAETGSRHQPFVAGDLFGGLTPRTDRERLASAVSAMGTIAHNVAAAVAAAGRTCECDATMAHNIRQYQLDGDWHKWFE